MLGFFAYSGKYCLTVPLVSAHRDYVESRDGLGEGHGGSQFSDIDSHGCINPSRCDGFKGHALGPQDAHTDACPDMIRASEASILAFVCRIKILGTLVKTGELTHKL